MTPKFSPTDLKKKKRSKNRFKRIGAGQLFRKTPDEVVERGICFVGNVAAIWETTEEWGRSKFHSGSLATGCRKSHWAVVLLSCPASRHSLAGHQVALPCHMVLPTCATRPHPLPAMSCPCQWLTAITPECKSQFSLEKHQVYSINYANSFPALMRFDALPACFTLAYQWRRRHQGCSSRSACTEQCY